MAESPDRNLPVTFAAPEQRLQALIKRLNLTFDFCPTVSGWRCTGIVAVSGFHRFGQPRFCCCHIKLQEFLVRRSKFLHTNANATNPSLDVHLHSPSPPSLTYMYAEVQNSVTVVFKGTYTLFDLPFSEVPAKFLPFLGSFPGRWTRRLMLHLKLTGAWPSPWMFSPTLKEFCS